MKKYYASITEHNRDLGFPEPEHPLFSIVHVKSKKPDGLLSCKEDCTVTTEFYTISIKKIIAGEIFYGRTKYDCQNGTMIFTSPGQEISTKGVKVASEGRALIIHKDYMRGFSIQEQIKKYHFFNYALHEALHLSPSEEKQIKSLFDAIEREYHNNQDEFTKELILDLISALLRYANRYYHRQFLARKEAKGGIQERFKRELAIRLNQEPSYDLNIPSIEDIASTLNVTPRYLSDALKAETGKTAKEWIHIELLEVAKDLLLSSDATISEVAYTLGFEYPNYFARLFKKKVGVTPTQYRNQIH
ncbi:helix-turn-helix transcriptional regulator [Candidatus Albibeggiatoa sp. nov. NOAA]|uniref:helix-turn-helix domain-containing protein n=1 Tax=Candidatus Albibeggiatoa sp. nov. NOAA TaxID=3162724 RepID=UPI003304C7DE|nr:helix-turn-helix transcriptional regulator [Thiotrichaceae bacterium]